jgi:hypothetical protein
MTDLTPSQPNSEQPTTPDTQAPSSAETQKPDTQGQQQPVPYERFKEVNDSLKTLKAELDTLKAAETKRADEDKKAKEKQLAAEQKWQELANERETERDAANQRASDLEAAIKRQGEVLQALYDARKAAVPEMYQPLLEKLDLVDRLHWIAENEAKLTKTTPNGIPATPAAQGRGELSVEERRRRATRTF